MVILGILYRFYGYLLDSIWFYGDFRDSIWFYGDSFGILYDSVILGIL
jgi:hypothetical protein